MSILDEALDGLAQPPPQNSQSQSHAHARLPVPPPLTSSTAPIPVDPSLTPNSPTNLYMPTSSTVPVPKIDEWPPGPAPVPEPPRNPRLRSLLGLLSRTDTPNPAYDNIDLDPGQDPNAPSALNPPYIIGPPPAAFHRPSTSSEKSRDQYAADRVRWRGLLATNDGASLPPPPQPPLSGLPGGSKGWPWTRAPMPSGSGVERYIRTHHQNWNGDEHQLQRDREDDGRGGNVDGIDDEEDETDNLFQDSDAEHEDDGDDDPMMDAGEGNFPGHYSHGHEVEFQARENFSIPGLSLDVDKEIKTPSLNASFTTVGGQQQQQQQQQQHQQHQQHQHQHQQHQHQQHQQHQQGKGRNVRLKSLRDAPPLPDTPYEIYFPSSDPDSSDSMTGTIASYQYEPVYDHEDGRFSDAPRMQMLMVTGGVHPSDAQAGLLQESDEYDPRRSYYARAASMASGGAHPSDGSSILLRTSDEHEHQHQTHAPSPTESQLAAQDFEFHNDLPEEVQMARFSGKAFRRALREVGSGLSRKEQWYAWQEVKGTPDTAPTGTRTPKKTLKTGSERCNCECCAEHCPCPADRCQCDVRKSGGAKGTCVDRNTCMCWPALDHEPAQQAGERSTDNPFASVVLKIAAGTRRSGSRDGSGSSGGGGGSGRRPLSDSSSLTEMAKIHSDELVAASIESWPAPEVVEQRLSQRGKSKSLPKSPLRSLPPKFPADPVSRPDTPRPLDPSIRKSVEPETPFYRRHRESTPAFEDRSQTPSPVSHGLSSRDVLMRDASDSSSPAEMPVTPGPALPKCCSSMSAAGNLPSPHQRIYTAPQTPILQSSPLRQTAKALGSTASGQLKSTKRKDKERRKSAVVGGKVDKSRNVARKVTVTAKEVTRLVEGQGLVKKAVEEIEEGIRKSSKEGEITPRRSQRLAVAQEGEK